MGSVKFWQITVPSDTGEYYFHVRGTKEEINNILYEFVKHDSKEFEEDFLYGTESPDDVYESIYEDGEMWSKSVMSCHGTRYYKAHEIGDFQNAEELLEMLRDESEAA